MVYWRRVPVGAAGTKHNVSRGKKSARGEEEKEGERAQEGVAREGCPRTTVRYPRVTGHTARFKRVGTYQ